MSELNTSLFTQVKGELVFNTKLSSGAYRFYTRILYLTGQNTHCWWTQKELAKEFGLSAKNGDRTIRVWSKECEQAGIMRIERPGYHKPNKYYPLVKVIPQDRQLSTPNYPPLKDRNQNTGIDRNQNTAKLHAPNNIQHDRAYRPLKGGIDFSKYLPGGAYEKFTRPLEG